MAEHAASLEAEAERILGLLDAMEVDALGAMLTDDAQSVTEITSGWTRGRAKGSVPNRSDSQPHHPPIPIARESDSRWAGGCEASSAGA